MGRFDDMADDLPFSQESGSLNDAHKGPLCASCNTRHFPRAACDKLGLMGENRRKNTNRKYKPQKGRMKLLVCLCCEWKCRASMAAIGAGIPNCPRKQCLDFGKPLTAILGEASRAGKRLDARGKPLTAILENEETK